MNHNFQNIAKHRGYKGGSKLTNSHFKVRKGEALREIEEMGEVSQFASVLVWTKAIETKKRLKFCSVECSLWVSGFRVGPCGFVWTFLL